MNEKGNNLKEIIQSFIAICCELSHVFLEIKADMA
jgi:hypothetical protein